MKELEEARQVLLKESKSIEKASHHIDEKFIKALDILAGSKNKIIFCGIGKSGHI